MSAINPEESNNTSDNGAISGLLKGSVLRTWGILTVAYALLLIGTGYIAFFQPAFNPATEIDEAIEARIADEATREFTLEALREEGATFKARRELALNVAHSAVC